MCGKNGSEMEKVFQLTPSRRATDRPMSPPVCFIFQLTPSRRATPIRTVSLIYLDISTHALTEGDIPGHSHSFHPVISTHALTEGDNSVRHFYRSAQYFNSRPHGGRPLYF